MEDNFWNDELVKEFGTYVLNEEYKQKSNHPLVSDQVKEFKRRKEIHKKDYEVIEYIGWHNLKKDTIFKKAGSGLFYPQGNQYNEGYNENYLNNHATDIKIHSVKRRDGEVFTVGDKIEARDGEYCNWGNIYRIISMSIKNELLAFEVMNIQETNPTGSIWREIENIRKLQKQVLFTTEDGVLVYDQDEYYYMRNWNYGKCRAFPNCLYGDKEGAMYFSSAEKAKEYILLNKPIEVSYKELDEYLFTKVYNSAQEIPTTLKEFFKSKIQL